MRPNWFIALPVDGGFLKDLPALPAGFRPFAPGDLHITIAFLGGCGEQAARRAMALLDERLLDASTGAMEVTLGRIVPMGRSRRRYTALSATIGRGNERVAELIGAWEDPLLAAASDHRPTRPSRPPRPHVTLARPPYRATDAARNQGLRWASSIDLETVHLRLDRLALYTWSDERPKRQFKTVEMRML